MKRYDFGPLADAMDVSKHEACQRLNIVGSTEVEYRRRGLTEKVADRLACRAGFHPSVIWPDWMDDVIVAEELVCARIRCTERFVPARWNQRYCSAKCQKAAATARWERRRYQTNPELAERKRQRDRDYYAQYGDYVRARQRAYDRRKKADRAA